MSSAITTSGLYRPTPLPHSAQVGDLLIVDFIPPTIENPSSEPYNISTLPTTTINMLIDEANHWLKMNNRFDVKTCEFFRYPICRPNTSVFFVTHCHGQYQKGLRLWLSKKLDNSVPSDELNIFSFSIGSRDMTNTEIAQVLNNQIDQHPDNGVILNMFTELVYISDNNQIDFTFCTWSENMNANRFYRSVFHLFRTKNRPQPYSEGIGFENIKGISNTSRFKHLIRRFNVWRSDKLTLRICNIQTLYWQIYPGGGHMLGYMEQKSFYTPLRGFIRVTYAFPKNLTGGLLHSPQLRLSDFTYKPMSINQANGKTNESCQEMISSATRLIQNSGASIVCGETFSVYSNPRRPTIETNYLHNRKADCSAVVNVFRIYLDGGQALPQIHSHVEAFSGCSCSLL